MVSTRKTNSSSAVNMRIQHVRQCKATRDPSCSVMSVCGACSKVVRSRQETRLWNLYSAISSYPDEPSRVHQREGTLEAWKCQNFEGVSARQVEPQIHDSVLILLNQMGRPDRITSQDGTF